MQMEPSHKHKRNQEPLSPISASLILVLTVHWFRCARSPISITYPCLDCSLVSKCPEPKLVTLREPAFKVHMLLADAAGDVSRCVTLMAVASEGDDPQNDMVLHVHSN